MSEAEAEETKFPELLWGRCPGCLFWLPPPCLAGAMASKLLCVVILVPGLAKGTVCWRIAQSFGLRRLSSGHFLWKNIEANTQVGDPAKQYREKGLVVPEHVITCLMMPEPENSRWMVFLGL